MERISIKTGETQISRPAFWSDVEVNLEDTDRDELYEKMTDMIKETKTRFERVEGTGLKFRTIIKLEIHSVKYNPLKGGSWIELPDDLKNKRAIVNMRNTDNQCFKWAVTRELIPVEGWKFRTIIKLEIHTVKYNPLKGGSWIELPDDLKNKRAIVNMRNTDNQCFKWAVTRELIPVEKNAGRIDTNLREKAKELNWNGIDFPVSWQGIKKFELLNKTISVNVYGWAKKKKYINPLRISDYAEERESHADLLLLENKETQHYCWIRKFSRLMYGQTTKHHGTRFYCKRCLNGFYSPESLTKHKEYCKNHPAAKRICPKHPKPGSLIKENILQFTNHHNKMRVSFVVYADFEAFTKPIDNCQPNPENS